MRSRSAAEYADFVLPSVRDGDRVIDVGCRPGSITVGLAQVAGMAPVSTSTKAS
jgi:trans-aconitate methyltransferase